MWTRITVGSRGSGRSRNSLGSRVALQGVEPLFDSPDEAGVDRDFISGQTILARGSLSAEVPELQPATDAIPKLQLTGVQLDTGFAGMQHRIGGHPLSRSAST